MLSLKRIYALSHGLKIQLPVLAEISVQQKRDASTYEHRLKFGEGRRNSFNGNVVTVFGGTGVMGRYVISRLAKVGTQLIVPYRGSEDDFRHIRLMGDLGQIVFLRIDPLDYDSILKTVSHSTGVINLIGRDFDTRNYTMEECMVNIASLLAKAAAESNVGQLTHMSHLMAREDSPSVFMQTKLQGEKAVLEAFPNATIMRPAQAYAVEDKYLNKFAYLRKFPLIPLVDNGMNTIKRPVHIADVAQAVVKATLLGSFKGKTFELYGPEQYYLYDMLDFTFRVIRERLNTFSASMKYCKAVGWVGEFSPFFPKITRDLVVREFLTEEATDEAFTFEDLDIIPDNINDHATRILRRHRIQYEIDDMTPDEPIKPSSAFQ